MAMSPGLFASLYGSCRLAGACVCLKPKMPWLGTSCPNWKPAGAKCFDDLKRIAAAQRAAKCR